jgi:hypothetical protein
MSGQCMMLSGSLMPSRNASHLFVESFHHKHFFDMGVNVGCGPQDMLYCLTDVIIATLKTNICIDCTS